MNSYAPREDEACAEQCPLLIRNTLDLISAKWSAPILLALRNQPAPLRYADLRRKIGAITPKELAKHLRQFEKAGLIDRSVHPTIPPRVEYALTTLGQSLSPSLESLADWSARFGDTVTKNQKAS